MTHRTRCCTRRFFATAVVAIVAFLLFAPFAYNPFSHGALHCPRTREALLAHVATVLEQRGIEYFVSHGTMLGAVRDHAIIPWTHDVDITVPGGHHLVDNVPCLDVTHHPELAQADSLGPMERPFPLWRFWERQSYMDIYNIHPAGNGEVFFVGSGGVRAPRDDVYPLTKVRIGEREYPCPRNATKLLALFYGESWRTPDAKHGLSW